MKKNLFSLLFILFPLFSLYAVPGVDSYIQDNSGEFVYYRDYSFTRESYIGILYYDEATYQIRYYAPNDDEQFLPEKDIAILMTVNPDADHWEMTGEKIISTILPGDDVDIVNYLHDIMYELSAKRRYVDVYEEEYSCFEEYAQFGGDVTMTYSSVIPIFNLKSIRKSEDLGHGQFECVTIGQLKNSMDTCFDDFSGFGNDNSLVSNSAKAKKGKKEKFEKQSFENHEFKLDSQWTHPIENMWLCGDDAIITCSAIPSYSEDKMLNKCFITRKLCESSNSVFVDFGKLSIIEGKNPADMTISFETYQPGEDLRTFSYKSLIDNSNGYDLFNFSAYKKPYEESQDYYLSILKSYKHN